MRQALLILLLSKALFAGICMAASEHAVAVTILSADLAARKVTAKTLDGKEEIFHFTAQTPVTSIAEAAMNKSLHGGEGYQFVVRFSMEHGEKVATSFDYVGREPWKTVAGKLIKIDATSQRLVLETNDTPEVPFIAGEHCTVETISGAIKLFETKSENLEQTPVIIHYLEAGNRKVAHLVEVVSKTNN